MESLVASKTLVDQAYEVIRDAICAGTLKPGERLTQDDVAKRLNVSRQPINNALHMLKAQGFVIESGRRGLAVAPLDPKLYESIYQFRTAIEPLAVRLATPRLTPAAEKHGRALIERGKKISERDDSVRAIEADMDFHSWIYGLSGNSLIMETLALHWQHLRRVMAEVLRHPDLTKQVWRDHSAIFDAMVKGDKKAASKLMHDHVTVVYQKVNPAVTFS